MGPTAVIPLATTTESQELTLLLGRARGLPVKNILDRSSDPYCVITLPVGDASSAELATFSFQSRTCHRTLEPQWYEEINLPTSRDEQLIQVHLFYYSHPYAQSIINKHCHQPHHPPTAVHSSQPLTSIHALHPFPQPERMGTAWS
jgi:Ca2+-dependent lipid-binding protein